MPLRDLKIGETLGLERGAAVVCVPVYGAYDLFAQCLLGLLSHTRPDVPILVCDDDSADPRIRGVIAEALTSGERPHAVSYLRQPENVGFVENMNSAIRACAPADIVVLNSDCVVPDGWFDGLRAAAYSESRVATATALTNAGTIVSVPYRNQPTSQLPHDVTLETGAGAVAKSSLRLRPDIPTCVGHCVYIRRSAFELVGEFDPTFSPGYEEEVDFSQRCVQYGLRHVVADDVFVFHRHAGSFGHAQETVLRRAHHHAIIAERYPYYDRWVDEVRADEGSRLAQSLAVASAALRGVSVSIDGRCLGGAVTGTQVVTLGVIAALDTYTDMPVRVLVPDQIGTEAAAFLAGRPNVGIVSLRELNSQPDRADVVHRPYQVTSLDDLEVLSQLGHRLVLSQLDNIALRNPRYFSDYADWQRYCDLTRTALASADQVVFISRHAADDARLLGLVEEAQINVVAPSTEPLGMGDTVPTRPKHASRLEGQPFLLCLGTDFVHKNRVFALRLLEALAQEDLFDGMLVFAGPKVASGSSGGDEATFLIGRSHLTNRVLDLGAVDEAEKRWLLEHASALLYPTTYEGFGLTPFEAADAGTPCIFASHTSLAEVLPESAALLVPWDAAATARRIAPVLVPGEPRKALVRSIKIAGARYTTSAAARGLTHVYVKALRAPRAGRVAAHPGSVQAMRADDHRANALSGSYDDPMGLGFAGSTLIVPPELRRPVLAVVNRRLLRKTAMGLHRFGHALRHGPGKSSSLPGDAPR